MRRRTLLAALPAALGALAVAGCGAGGLEPAAAGDQTQGRQLFTARCGGCHQLAAAGTQGTQGPNLDAAFAHAREQGFSDDTIRSVVADQIRWPGEPMPPPDQTLPLCKTANQPQGCVDNRNDAIASIAAFVAATAGANGPEAKAGTKSTNGKEIFSTNCASCHTLKAASATGTIGPNLDQLKPPFAIAKRQVINGGGAMPAFKDKLTPQQIDAVAKFVSSSAGK